MLGVMDLLPPCVIVVATPAFGACKVIFVTERLPPEAVTFMVAPLAGEVVTTTSRTPPHSRMVPGAVLAAALLQVMTPSKKYADVFESAVCDATAPVLKVVGELVVASGV